MTKTTAIVFIFLFSVLFRLEKLVSFTQVTTICFVIFIIFTFSSW